MWYVSWEIFLHNSLQNKTPEHIEQGTVAYFWVDLRQCQQWVLVYSLSKCFTTGLSTAIISPGSISLGKNDTNIWLFNIIFAEYELVSTTIPHLTWFLWQEKNHVTRKSCYASLT